MCDSMTVQQVITIPPTAPEKFDEIFNSRMGEIPKRRILDTQINIQDGRITAVILYEATKGMGPKTIRDEFHAEGHTFLCRQCPHIDPPSDKRIKYIDCKYAEYGHTRLDSECCEMLYKQIKQGAVTLRYYR